MEPGKNQEPESAHDSAQDEDAELLSLSAEYSASLSIGNKPDLEALLAKVAPDRQASLLKHIHSLANVYAGSGSAPQQSTGGTGPGTIADAKSQELVDSASMTQTGQGTAAFAAEERTPAKQLGDYDLLGELGRGGMGVVYRARHRVRGDVVALKVLPHVDGESLHRFKREFRSLADISHPNLVGLRSLENEGEQWFFTMDLVEDARSFRRFVRPNNELNLGRLKSSMLQLCEGLRKLHELDIIHRDLKPSNVVVDANGRVVILDFGLVSEIRRNEQTMTIASVSGTPAYMSPEAAASEDETFASDWYSVGVMLYQSLTGGLPFDGEPIQILSDKRTQDAPSIATDSELPAELVDVCMALLAREPASRPGLAEIQAACGDTKRVGVTSSLAEHDELLGRDWHLAQLKSSFEAVAHTDEPSIVFVSGKSGEGKSALIEAFLSELRSTQDIAILSGRCYDRESVPFKALDSLIDALASYLRKMDQRKAAFLLPDDTGFLARVFPVLMRVEAVAERPTPDLSGIDEQQVRKRSFLALKELLRRLALQIPIILFCDDLQWGDNDSAQVLMDVLSGTGMPRLMFLGSYRSDEAALSPFLNSWHHEFQSREGNANASSVEVAPLKEVECQSLLQRRFPSLPKRRAAEISGELFEETGGNPFFVNEVLDCLQITGNSMRRIPLSQVLAEKLSNLPSEAPELLNTVAVSGQALNTDELLSAVGMSKTSFATLHSMRNLRLLRFVDESESGRVDTYHDKIRETVLSAMGAASRKPYHAQLAKALETKSPEIDQGLVSRILNGEDIEHPDVQRIYDLSFHSNASGDQKKGPLYALLAGRQARRQYSQEVAAQQFKLAWPQIEQGELRPQYARAVAEFAESLYLIGDFETSERLLQAAEHVEMSSLDRARILSLSCETALARNQPAAAMQFCLAALEETGERVPRGKLSAIMRILPVLARHLLRMGRPSFGTKPAKERDRLRLKLFERVLRVAMFADGKYVPWGVLRGVEEARKFAPIGESAQLHSAYAIGASEIGLQKHSATYVESSLQCAQQTDDEHSAAFAYAWSGSSALAQGDYDAAVELLEIGKAKFTRVGGHWHLHLNNLHQSQSLFMQGKLKEALLSNWETFRNAVRQSSMRTNCTAYLQCRMTEGQFPIESVEQQIVLNDEDVLSTCNLDKAYGIRKMHLGEYDEAIQFFERALDRPYKATIPNWHVFAGMPFLVRALRLRAAQLADTNANQASAMRRRAVKLAKRSLWICRFFPTEYSSALREYGELLADIGKYRQAERQLRKSCQASKKYGTPYELAKSELALAELGVLQSQPEAPARRSEAQAKLAEFQQQISDVLSEIESQL